MTLTTTQHNTVAAWATALETSRKAKGALVSGGGRECCLGVLCRVVGVSRDAMKGWGMPDAVGVNTTTVAGISFSATDYLALVNDGGDDVQELTHKDIALLVWMHLYSDGGVLGA